MKTSRPPRFDVFLAVAAFLGGLLLWSLGQYVRPAAPLPAWAALVPLTVICAAQLFRRTAPRVTLVAGTAALVLSLFTVGSLVTVLVFTDVVYAAVLYGSPRLARRIPVASVLLTGAATIAFVLWTRSADGLLLGVLVGLVTFAPAVTAVIVRNHREAADTARLRADQTRLLAEMDRVQAVTAERNRMARELHDMVANHLTAIAIHSTAALSLDDPATTRKVLGTIRENSVAGLAEMRRLIGLLREGADDLAPAAAPTLAGVEQLVGRARTNGAASGLAFTLDDRREDGVPLSVPADLAAYRIVQESLTNAQKHADPGEVRITLTQAAEGTLTVNVTSPYGDRSGPRAPGSGSGLTGIRERVALLGGQVSAGPEPGPPGGPARIWRVRAVLPVRNEEEPLG
ncbi:sensor histidine kinase [Streptomyces sp. NPDC058953]|uniref:sensor histidine kinase n=1 Tax=unclassified Streptomyces TaxID=2593676 RepID=UPI0036C65C63